MFLSERKTLRNLIVTKDLTPNLIIVSEKVGLEHSQTGNSSRVPRKEEIFKEYYKFLITTVRQMKFCMRHIHILAPISYQKS